ncbi:Fic family protein [Hyalangium rubrum]|uniref:Fic family protein n=1 Tax=Hyalangium rubrum TaxID=3103134 RepID=A0ABU5H971_9BACT|nr:Fic family protein [Hyalangium sp. s54d21]MDY7229393.1 Fic family protein [Hyalangium sp. s54d21]
MPHLQASLALDWTFPHLRPELEAASARAFEETHAQERFLAELDTPAHEDPAREARFRDALAHVRALADAQAPLTYERLREVQARVLGHAVSFRTGDAFAHGGAHRYLFFPELEAMFTRKVEADAADGCHPVVQAVRLYLDLAFFHPFPDGNARAARLGFEFLLRRARLPTPPLTPLVLLPKHPGDVVRYAQFVRLAARGIAGRGGGAESP